MKRLSLMLSGLFLAASMTGCCCHHFRGGGCGPCASPCSPCSTGGYVQQVQPAYGPVPVSYGGAPGPAYGGGGCPSCNNLSY